MKVSALLLLPVLLSSCGLLQMPARLINQVIAPLTDAGTPEGLAPTTGIAIRVSDPARSTGHRAAQREITPRIIIPES